MPSLCWNLETWAGSYDWTNRGEEWSEVWGGSESQWFGAIFPRIGRYLPVQTALEIAPGYGRWTKFLMGYCTRLIGIDLSESCVDFCRASFSHHSGVEFYLNNGKSLAAVPDSSIDFTFSFDSLVHAEADVIQAYVKQLAHKLGKNGIAFLHHSNFGACPPGTPNPHCRAEFMCADKFADFCSDVGVTCISQELINWGQPELVDCLSMFTPHDSKWESPRKVLENYNFMQEASLIKAIAGLYHEKPASLP